MTSGRAFVENNDGDVKTANELNNSNQWLCMRLSMFGEDSGGESKTSLKYVRTLGRSCEH
jgi:hypothetical protein